MPAVSLYGRDCVHPSNGNMPAESVLQPEKGKCRRRERKEDA
jgi:hypothetical protein